MVTDSSERQTLRRREWLLFFFLIVVLFPILTVMFVGGYGMVIWISQLIAGPPGI